jgi:endonuclease/exonuclease/phosphatase family metal-dependent hydrolase
MAFELVTWNLNGLEPSNRDARTEAALSEMLLGGDLMAILERGEKPVLPDVIVLQEVVERTFFAHLVPHLRAAGYAITPAEPPARSYYELVGVRNARIERSVTRPFARTGMGRCLTEVTLKRGPEGAAERWVVLTAHLESLKPSSELRQEQATAVLDRLATHAAAGTPAIFGGDTNLRNAEWEAVFDPKRHAGVQDAWVASGSPSSERATWGNARYDRVWFTDALAVRSFVRVGVADVPGIDEPPSDHVGLRAGFDVRT